MIQRDLGNGTYANYDEAVPPPVPADDTVNLKISWDTEVTESYSAVISYREFADALTARGYNVPSLDEIRNGTAYADWDDAGSDFENDPEDAAVSDRTITRLSVHTQREERTL